MIWVHTDAPEGPQLDLSDFAEGGSPPSSPSPADRVAHLFGYRLGVDLPDVLTVKGLSGIDLAAVLVLAVPLWALPADQRSTVAALCEHP